jgi:uncharacterized protein YkwD
MNYVDIIIFLFVVLLAYTSFLRGFIRDFADLIALLISIVLAMYTYVWLGAFIISIVSLPENIASTIAFFTVWFVGMFVYYAIMTLGYEHIPEKVRQSKINKWLGIIPGTLRAILFAWFTINLLYILAISGTFKQAMNRSFISKQLIKNNQVVNDFLNKTFGSIASGTTNFITVTPQSNETITLGYKTTEITTDYIAATEMLDLVNSERKSNGLAELILDDKLSVVGQEHCKDMFANGYFSHYSPDGKSPFDRMLDAKINFMIAGENLALAPTTAEAFAGLMESPGHRANMLSKDFGRVGIGVIDSGINGKMFAQEFTN